MVGLLCHGFYSPAVVNSMFDLIVKHIDFAEL